MFITECPQRHRKRSRFGTEERKGQGHFGNTTEREKGKGK